MNPIRHRPDRTVCTSPRPGGEPVSRARLSAVRYDFAAPRSVAAVLRATGGCGVWVDDDDLDVRFGPWRVRTPLTNIAGADVTGPYSALTGLGVRLSLADRGLTFGTSTRTGVCLRFHRPVRGLDPAGLIRHPGLTVTVSEPYRLARLLRQRLAAQRDPA